MPATTVRLSSSGKVQHLVAIGLAATLLLSACGKRNKPADAGQKPASAMTVTVEPVRKARIARSVEATGSIQPWQEVIIGPEVGGYRVSAVLVEIGDKVKRGQTLVRLSADMLEAEVASRNAALRSAEARATNAAAAYRRGQTIASTGALSQANLDTLTADQVATQAQVETTKSDLATSTLRLKYTQVIAPDDGVVTSRLVSVGQVAQAGGEMLRLLRQGRVEWRAEVPESRLAQIKVGQDVSITSADGTVIAGKVRAVAPTVMVNNRSALVYVDIQNGNARPGMFARGRIGIGQGEALLVPVTSVVMQDGYSYVFVLKAGDVVERRLVQPVGVQGDSMEIASGLVAEETIAVKGAGFLKDRDPVRVAREDAAAAAPATTVKAAP